MRTFATALFAIIAMHIGNAQDCNSILLGEIVDFHDNVPLENATVLISGSDKSATSDGNGKFRFEGLCDVLIELEVFHPECKTKLISVNIEGDSFEKISLEHHLEELDEVKVVGAATKNKTNSALEESMQIETIEQFSSQSLGDALKEITGVSSLNTGANIVKPAIHGLNGSRVLILNDGVRMQDMEWGDEHAPNIDINGYGSIAVIKGAAALQYGGDAIGGVIVIEQPRVKEKDTLFGKTVINGVSNGQGGNISSELTRSFENGLFVKVQGAFKRLGDRRAPDYVLSNTSISEKAGQINFGKLLFNWGVNFKYSYFDSDLAILSASHIGNVDDLIRSINNREPETIDPFTYDIASPRQEVTHHIASANFYKRFQGLGKWNVQYDFQNNRRFEFDVRIGDDANTPAIDLDLTTHTFSTDFKWDSKSEYKIHAGVLGRYQDNFANPATGVRRLIPDYNKYDFGVFIIGEYRIGENMVLDGGLRYDYNRIDAKKFYRTSRWEERGYDTEFQDWVIDDLGTQLLVNPLLEYHNLSGTLGFEYKVDNASTLRFNYALGQRAPNPSELFSDGLHHSAARIELGDLRINNETSHKFSISKEAEYEQWGYVIEPYANFLSDFILLEPTGVEFTIRGAFPVWGYRQTSARILGLDASVHSNFWSNWQTSHKFSLVKGFDKSTDVPLINMPSPNLRNGVTFNRPKWSDFEISFESNYVFRQNEFPADITVFSPEQQQDVVLQINTPPDAYHLMSLFSKVQFPIGNKNSLQLALTINNLFNTNYRDYLNRQRLFADDLGRNFILQLNFKY